MSEQTLSTDDAHTPRSSKWLLALCYVTSFVLGACIDIIRHSYDKIVPAIAADEITPAITQRMVIAAALIIIVIAGVYLGSRWSGQKFGLKHRTGLQAVFILTPVIVYVLEH